jgi:hypothetical protein
LSTSRSRCGRAAGRTIAARCAPRRSKPPPAAASQEQGPLGGRPDGRGRHGLDAEGARAKIPERPDRRAEVVSGLRRFRSGVAARPFFGASVPLRENRSRQCPALPLPFAAPSSSLVSPSIAAKGTGLLFAFRPARRPSGATRGHLALRSPGERASRSTFVPCGGISHDWWGLGGTDPMQMRSAFHGRQNGGQSSSLAAGRGAFRHGRVAC